MKFMNSEFMATAMGVLNCDIWSLTSWLFSPFFLLLLISEAALLEPYWFACYCRREERYSDPKLEG